jgi:phosphoribosylaminoimidazolecarboxamide formyltransferase / IMP cyclohydrolase
MTEFRIRRALLSLTDKTGSVGFARGLSGQGVEILSTGGTARHLREAGVTVRDISEVTGFPEIMNGRVKTLHPAVHGGILALRGDESHLHQAEEHGIPLIDLVAVNLYAFAKTVARDGVSLAEAMENVDIGGPTMIRAAAKNHTCVAVVTDPADYAALLEEMETLGGSLSEATRRRLAVKAFALTASYDAAITAWLEKEADPDTLPDRLEIITEKGDSLRYGENPHLRAAFYRLPGERAPSLATAEILNGKALSYNNILDTDAAFELVKEFSSPAAVVIKHTNPCGAATAGDIIAAYRDALAGDSLSAFGGILALNRPLTVELAEVVADPGCFFEVVIAPGIDAAAVKVFRKKVKWGKNVRILSTPPLDGIAEEAPDLVLRSVKGGILAQDRDLGFTGEEMKPVSAAIPDQRDLDTLAFAWRVVKHVKSNGIVLVQSTEHGNCLVGTGAGQMSRIDSTVIAGRKAGERSSGSVMASDAFFPFRDCVDMAAELGVRAIIQPGGSVRDKESIAAADEHQIAMVFTGRRHFRH